ncbi:ubiquitin-like FUBI-ribosomal protein eS30 fusion protein isoform X1 [Diadema antillarum]|uniref:ubiquitin-like FUBI-ribosomal protein eS30 fusion protein isoform X1 n=2 Tax=Diadema antillarum TaxID=105358 RepID=UPI003A8BB5DE
MRFDRPFVLFEGIKMQLFLRADQTLTVEVTGEESVSDLKVMIQGLSGLPVTEQVLSCCGTPLDEDLTLTQNGLQDLSTVDLSGRLLGGKVHGSLARAGKVRGQTPKVDPQEKKKKKVGRAKRRMQYNRRFVNVVQTFGKRRGPNSNS